MKSGPMSYLHPPLKSSHSMGGVAGVGLGDGGGGGGAAFERQTHGQTEMMGFFTPSMSTVISG